MAYAKNKYLKTYAFKLFLFSVALLLLFLFFLFLSIKSGIFKSTPNIIKTFSSDNDEVVIVIDAGHGGVDTGASAVVGKYESEICLEVAQKVSAYLKLSGFKNVMTRTTDNMLTSENKALTRKQADLSGRVEFTNKLSNPIFVSIHMNTYPLESCKGAQVFYSGNNPESQNLANIVKNNFISNLQTENKRENKKAGSNIYVLHKLNCPAILIECGFLTNFEEATKLNDAEYQKKLALTIAQSLCEYLETNNKSGELYG